MIGISQLREFHTYLPRLQALLMLEAKESRTHIRISVLNERGLLAMLLDGRWLKIVTFYVISLFQDRVKFFVWTKENPGMEDLILPSNLVNDLNASHFKPGLPIKILIHGFSDNGKTEWVTNMRDAFLEHGDSVVISVDWSAWVGT